MIPFPGTINPKNDAKAISPLYHLRLLDVDKYGFSWYFLLNN